MATSTGTTAHALPREGSVVAGRDETCDVSIDDLTVSRRHARLDIALLRGELSIVDLGSSNGTFVAGQRIDPDRPTMLAIGSVVGLGSATIVVHEAASFARPHPLRSHAYFEARVEDECTRAMELDERFTVVRLDCHGQAARRLEGHLARWLRPMDVVAEYAPNRYELLFSGTERGPAAAVVDRLRAHLERIGARTSAATAVFPDDARTPEELLTLLDDEQLREKKSTAFVRSASLERFAPRIDRLASSALPVLVSGEPGTGKEAIARYIHARGDRAKRPFVVVPCAMLSAPETLLEKARGGTVLLDEAADIPPAEQPSLLRVIEQARTGRAADVRFIAATSRALDEEVACGGFREELYFCLAETSIVIPPLRERVEDIEPFAQVFLRRACQRLEKTPPALSGAALEALKSYSWPGNVRELSNTIIRAAHLCTGPALLLEHLPIDKMGPVLRAEEARPLFPPPMRDDRPTLVPRASSSSSPPSGRAPRTRDHRLVDASSERVRIQEALDACGGNQTQAARLLGMSRRTLLNRLEEYALPRPRKHRAH